MPYDDIPPGAKVVYDDMPPGAKVLAVPTWSSPTTSDWGDSAPAEAAAPTGKPKRTIRAGFIPEAFAHAEVERQKRMENPLQSVLTDVGNISALPVSQALKSIGINPSMMADPTAAGIVHGLTDAVAGPLQMGAHALAKIPGLEGLGPKADRTVNTVESYFRDNYDPSKSGELTGQALPFLLTAGASAAPKAFDGIARVVEALKMLGKGAGIGYVTGASTPEENVQSEQDYWSKSHEKGKKGAKFGLALGAAGGLASELSAGNPLAGMLGSQAEREAALLKAQEIRDLTKSVAFPGGAEPTLGQSLNSPLIKSLEEKSAYIPLSGQKAAMQAQNSAIEAKLTELADTSAPGLGPLGAGTEIRNSAQRTLQANESRIGARMNSVEGRADSAGLTPDIDPYLAAIEESILRESRLTDSNPEIIKGLQSMRDRLMKGESATTFGDLALDKTRAFQNAKAGAGAAGAEAAAMAKYQERLGIGAAKSKEAHLLRVDPTEGPANLLGESKRNDAAWAKEVVPYDPNQPATFGNTRAQARALHGQEGFENNIPKSILGQDSPDMAAYVNQGLDAPGQEAVRSEILRRVNEAAPSTKNAGIVSPLQARKEILSHQNFIKEFFPQAKAEELTQLADAMDTLSQSGQFLERITTGKLGEMLGTVKGVGGAATAVAAGSAGPGALAAASAPVAMARLYNKLSNTPGGKEWLLAASKLQTDSPQMQALMTRLPALIGLQMDSAEGIKAAAEAKRKRDLNTLNQAVEAQR